MTQMMTRSKVQILLVPDLEQTEAQSPSYMLHADLEPASLRDREREKLPG